MTRSTDKHTEKQIFSSAFILCVRQRHCWQGQRRTEIICENPVLCTACPTMTHSGAGLSFHCSLHARANNHTNPQTHKQKNKQTHKYRTLCEISFNMHDVEGQPQCNIWFLLLQCETLIINISRIYSLILHTCVDA